jgi:hypothetical protein
VAEFLDMKIRGLSLQEVELLQWQGDLSDEIAAA